jgi:hypothetical protein
MRETILSAAALVLLSSAVMAQSVDTKSAPHGACRSSDSMGKSDASKGNMTKKKMSKSATTRKTAGSPVATLPVLRRNRPAL